MRKKIRETEKELIMPNTDAKIEKLWMTPRESAEFMGVSLSTFEGWLKEGIITPIMTKRRGCGGWRRFRRDTLVVDESHIVDFSKNSAGNRSAGSQGVPAEGGPSKNIRNGNNDV